MSGSNQPAIVVGPFRTAQDSYEEILNCSADRLGGLHRSGKERSPGAPERSDSQFVGEGLSAPPGLGGTPQTGNLAVYWLTPVEFDDLQNGRHVIRTVVHVLERMQSFLAAVDLSKAPVQFSSMVSPGPVLLFGILDLLE